VIVLAVEREADGAIAVTGLPITHSAPADPAVAVEIPLPVKRPAMIAAAGERASLRFIDFFTAHSRPLNHSEFHLADRGCLLDLGEPGLTGPPRQGAGHDRLVALDQRDGGVQLVVGHDGGS
jgi:hypothetical protein